MLQTHNALPLRSRLVLSGELSRDPDVGILRVNGQPIDLLLSAAIPAGKTCYAHIEIDVYPPTEDPCPESENLGARQPARA